MDAGGLFADVEGPGDLRVGQAVAEQGEYFAFAWGQADAGGVRCGPGRDGGLGEVDACRAGERLDFGA